MNLKGKVAIVTGGASGIGKAISLKLASLGANIVINYHSSEANANSLVKFIESTGGHALAVKANISLFEEANMLVEKTIEFFGHVDILVNNAGITKDNLIMRMTEDDFDLVIDTNLKGAWNMSKHVSKYMAKARFGKIINITSVSGLIGNAGQTNYSSSKAGLVGLTMSLARELAKRNIYVNAIAPGFINTNMTDKLPVEVIDKFKEQIPLSRLGEVDDVANAVSFLASDLSNYMTGQVIRVDGGLVMG
ncbi:MAG: 3-oxoacyl-[acyl-carrier-protein] reductase [Candidatus Izemoplasmatales bacterium]|jgi:3-oxoacyl-[acyl-carrier protein] reductase|nr:3-oxoacyl-[acyl-carrier-protein] reductase [Candidatus Izemoplasmatales bacterium]